jgi:signal transduction histidine kinase
MTRSTSNTSGNGRSGRLLVDAGIVAWAVAGLPRGAAWLAGRAPFDERSLAWCTAYAVFGVTFVLTAATERFVRRRTLALAVQSLAALVVLALGRSGFEPILFCVVAGEAPLIIGERAGLVWVAAQAAAMVIVDVVSGPGSRGGLFSPIAYVGFQLFAFGASRFAMREAAAGAELARLHAELLATQDLLADSTRTAERLRIARELHDALGHHLTALSLQLELARNVTEGRAKGPVDRAHGLTKDLLAELRTVVSAMREDAPIGLARALRTLASGIPHPHVHLDVADDLQVEAALAHTIFRCVQEALTNTVRHAGAANVYLTVEADGGTVTVTARDDGRGAAEVHAGNGLSGLRERIEEMGGTMEVVARRGAGLTLRALLPVRAGAT